MAQPTASFRCFKGCAGTFPLTQAIYRCPKCDGLLEVAHDLGALREKSGEEWRALFDRRWAADVERRRARRRPASGPSANGSRPRSPTTPSSPPAKE